MPQDPLPHPSSSPHHPVTPSRQQGSSPVPFPSGPGGAQSSGSPPTAAGQQQQQQGTPPKAGQQPVGAKLRTAAGAAGTTPKDTIPMAKTPRKQRSSRFHVTEKVELERLPGFMGASAFFLCLLSPTRCAGADLQVASPASPSTEVPAPERHDLFLQKLHQCAVVFDFNDVSTDIGGKQIKAATLAEMLEWITTQRGVITESVYPEVVAMVRFRCFSPLHLGLARPPPLLE